MNILCFLTVKPSQQLYDFAKELKHDKYQIYICIDNDSYNIPISDDASITILKINSDICENSGFKSSVLSFNNKACSRDKALYYFCKINLNYDYIWFLEEDVFIPTKYTISNIDEKYKGQDLLSASHIIKNSIDDIMKPDMTFDWWWGHIIQKNKIQLLFPFAWSMICAIRVSKKLLMCISEYADKYYNLFLDEALFNTIALQNNLIIENPTELSTILYVHDLDIYDWQFKDITFIDHLYHPLKDYSKHCEYREALNEK